MSKRHPNRYPADWGMHLHRFHADKYVPSKHLHAAADVTVIGPPTLAPRSTNQTSRNLGQHQAAEVEKWRGSTTKTCTGDQLITDLLRNNVVLLPMTVGPFGEPGPVHQRTFFGDRPALAPPYSYGTKPTPTLLAMANEAQANDAPHSALPRADKAWVATHGRKKWFGHTYRDTTPSQWACNNMGTATCRALAKHILGALHRCNQHGVVSSKPPSRIDGALTYGHTSSLSHASAHVSRMEEILCATHELGAQASSSQNEDTQCSGTTSATHSPTL